MSPRLPFAENDSLSEAVIGAFYFVYNRLGYGFVESVYARAMELELARRGFHVAREISIDVAWGIEILGSFRADMIVNDSLILEFKAGPRLAEADFLQAMNYLRASNLRVALLMHFGPKPEVRRVHRPS
jgi:GxxExxY protein